MTAYLLDTNIVSQATKTRPAPEVVQFLSDVPLSKLYLSAVTLGELEWGIEAVTDASKRAALRQWLTQTLLPAYTGRLLPIDADVMVTWARMVLSSGKKPGQVPCMDALIAATALHHGLTLVTRNESDFSEFQVSLLNPWQDL